MECRRNYIAGATGSLMDLVDWRRSNRVERQGGDTFIYENSGCVSCGRRFRGRCDKGAVSYYLGSVAEGVVDHVMSGEG